MNKICPSCGVEYVAKRENQVCCCHRCAQDLWRKNNPEKCTEYKKSERKRNADRYTEYRIKNKAERYEKRKLWYESNKELEKSKAKKYAYKLRKDCVDAYGGKCETCGIDDTDVLCFHHRNFDGKIHRHSLGGSGTSVLKWCRLNGYPDSVMLICANCHMKLHADDRHEL